MAVSGLPKCSRSMSWFGTLSGTLRKPSMSSEKATSLVGTSRHHLEGLPHPTRARNFTECPDMRQARGAVAGLEQHFIYRAARGATRFDARNQFARLLEGPGAGGSRKLAA